MIKREKKLSIPTLNRLNEEDENVLVDNQENNKSNKINSSSKKHQQNSDEIDELIIDKKMLIKSIDGVFKLIPFCESSNILLDDRKRLGNLEQLLINKLILNYEDNIEQQKNESKTIINKLNSSQYGIYLSSSFDSNIFKSNLNQKNSKSKEEKLENENVINLKNLNLTTECLNQFSIKNLLSKPVSKNEMNIIIDDKMISVQNEDYLNLINNSKKIRLIDLTNNNLKKIPIQLLNMFENLELINLSDNNFESINLISLVKFSSLKEINLSNNYLRSFKSASLINEKINEEIDDDDDDQDYYNMDSKSDDLSNPLFFRIERLDLANNQLKSSNCVIISKFKNLKYLNLSNNLFQINSTTPDAQLPWLKSANKFKNLIELNLSKNNKLNYGTAGVSVTSLRNVSSFSIYSVNNNNHQSSTSFTSNYNAYTSFKDPNSEFFNSEKSQPSNISSSDSSRLSGSSNALSSFNCLINLRKLDLSENNLINMPNDIKDLKYLEELNLSRNKLMFIPNELTELKNLRRLLFSDNNLTELSETFCSYANFKPELIALDLSKNNITNENFSSRIGLFQNLIELNLSENQFDSIPNTLPKNLEYLNLNKNKLKSLMTKPMSDSVYNDNDLLLALNMDEISKRKSKHLLKSSILSHKTNNSQFVINKNQNENLYDQPDVDQFDQLLLPHVFFLRNLKILHLHDNHIQDVPSDFGILNSNLEFIDLSSNLLTQLSVSLCRGLGNSLRFLDLSSNRIRDITDKLRELCSVEYLNLSHNRILKLNFEICNDLKSLKELHLNNNFIEELPLFSINTGSVANNTNYTNNKTSNSSDKSYVTVDNKTSSFELKTSTGSLKNNSSAMSKNDSSNNFGKNNKPQNSNLLLSSTDKRKKFTFNLPNLKKLDLSNNQLKETFSIHNSFALSQNLIEINLSSNRIKFLDLKANEKSKAWALEFLKTKNQPIVDEDQIKQLRTPIYRLLSLKSIDLSNNDIRYIKKGGFVKFLCELYKFAPNLNKILYDQINGAKLGEPQIMEQTNDTFNELTSKATKKDLVTNLINDDFYFDFDEYEIEDDFLFEVNNNIMNEINLKRNEYYETLLNNLRILDLSNNNLKTLPKFIYDLKNLKEIYFNGNLLNKIPNEMYTFKNESVLEEEENFESLKRLQELRIRAENEAKRRNENLNDLDEDYEEEEEKTKKNRKSKKNRSKKDESSVIKELTTVQKKPISTTATATASNIKLLSDTVEIIHFNNNKIEHLPENLFSNFKNLKEIKLLNNPLKEPPLESVCISSRFIKNKIETEMIGTNADNNKIKNNKNDSDDIIDSTYITILNKNKTKSNNSTSFNISNTFSTTSAKEDLSNFSLPNLFFETNENLKPLQSYMIKYKNREGNFF
jgi:Leucine-rich repeat (LRR) protein